jgi:hypothetical protein
MEIEELDIPIPFNRRMELMTLTVTPQTVPCNGTDLVRGEPINGKVPIWHMSYYNCDWCDDKTPCDDVAFELADGSTVNALLITGDGLLWRRLPCRAPRGIVLTELVRSVSPPCPRGKHLYWRWRFMDDDELEAFGPPENDR